MNDPTSAPESVQDLADMRGLAIRLARAADDLAVARRSSAIVDPKGDGAAVVTEVDRDCEALIVEGIRRRYPAHSILAEESSFQGASSVPVHWLVDPLDGTNNSVMGLAHQTCASRPTSPRPSG